MKRIRGEGLGTVMSWETLVQLKKQRDEKDLRPKPTARPRIALKISEPLPLLDSYPNGQLDNLGGQYASSLQA